MFVFRVVIFWQHITRIPNVTTFQSLTDFGHCYSTKTIHISLTLCLYMTFPHGFRTYSHLINKSSDFWKDKRLKNNELSSKLIFWNIRSITYSNLCFKKMNKKLNIFSNIHFLHVFFTHVITDELGY